MADKEFVQCVKSKKGIPYYEMPFKTGEKKV